MVVSREYEVVRRGYEVLGPKNSSKLQKKICRNSNIKNIILVLFRKIRNYLKSDALLCFII